MLRAMTVLVAVLLACCGHLGAADDDKGQTKRTISLSLVAVEGAVKRGALPKFRLTIRNTGKQPERVLDVRDGRRQDLQDTYYDLEVTDSEKVVDLPRAISDPGPISDKDFVALKPGEAVTVHLSDFAPRWRDYRRGGTKPASGFGKILTRVGRPVSSAHRPSLSSGSEVRAEPDAAADRSRTPVLRGILCPRRRQLSLVVMSQEIVSGVRDRKRIPTIVLTAFALGFMAALVTKQSRGVAP